MEILDRRRASPTAHNGQPHELRFWIDGGHFKSLRATGAGSLGVPQFGVTDFENGFEIVIDDQRRTPGGVLIALSLGGDSIAWAVATNSKEDRICGCAKEGRRVELGKPMTTPGWPRLSRQGS